MADQEGRTIVVHTGFSGGQMVLAALGGAIAGAVAGLLLAPRAGAETRAGWQGMADLAKERMARLPDAIREAGAAAVVAFDEAKAKGAHPAPRARTRPVRDDREA